MALYEPDSWVVLKLTSLNEPPLFKLLAGWSGGYLHGSSWQLNSGITKVEPEGDTHYRVHGHSGSVYRVHKNAERISMSFANTLAQMLEFPGVTESSMKECLESLQTS